MTITATALRNCTLPKGMYPELVKKGQQVGLPVNEWDEVKHPFLKHFEQGTPVEINARRKAEKALGMEPKPAAGNPTSPTISRDTDGMYSPDNQEPEKPRFNTGKAKRR